MVFVGSGYMSPEYAMQGRFSVKSDVFSFGVLILEIISGQKNNCFYQSEHDEDLSSYVSGSNYLNFVLNFMNANIISSKRSREKIIGVVLAGQGPVNRKL